MGTGEALDAPADSLSWRPLLQATGQVPVIGGDKAAPGPADEAGYDRRRQPGLWSPDERCAFDAGGRGAPAWLSMRTSETLEAPAGALTGARSSTRPAQIGRAMVPRTDDAHLAPMARNGRRGPPMRTGEALDAPAEAPRWADFSMPPARSR